jgi:hypothetical protein
MASLLGLRLHNLGAPFGRHLGLEPPALKLHLVLGRLELGLLAALLGLLGPLGCLDLGVGRSLLQSPLPGQVPVADERARRRLRLADELADHAAGGGLVFRHVFLLSGVRSRLPNE